MIIRRRHNSEFSIIPNALANDARLSFCHRGLMLYLLSKPDHWQLNSRDIEREGGIGREKAQGLIRDLIEAGYIVRGKRSQVTKAYDYEVRDVPGKPAQPRQRIARQLAFEFDDPIAPKAENPTLGNAFPKAENPKAENQAEYIRTDSLERTEVNKPKGGRRPRYSMIPKNFEPDLAEAEKIGLTPAEAVAQAERFVDRAKARSTRSRDWLAAWRDWCRIALDRRAKLATITGGAGSSKKKGKTLTEMMHECDQEIAARRNTNAQDEPRHPAWPEHFAGPTIDLAAAA